MGCVSRPWALAKRRIEGITPCRNEANRRGQANEIVYRNWGYRLVQFVQRNALIHFVPRGYLMPCMAEVIYWSGPPQSHDCERENTQQRR